MRSEGAAGGDAAALDGLEGVVAVALGTLKLPRITPNATIGSHPDPVPLGRPGSGPDDQPAPVRCRPVGLGGDANDDRLCEGCLCKDEGPESSTLDFSCSR